MNRGQRRLNKVLQVNANHAARAQNLFLQTMAEHGFAVTIVAEPYRIPDNNPLWHGNRNGTVAMVWRQTANPLPFTPLEEGHAYAVARCGDMIIIGAYISPRVDRADFERHLEEIERSVNRWQGRPLMIAGDFNAHAASWGSATIDVKGRILEDWTASLGLHCLNRGTTSTCVRTQRESILDVTFGNSVVVERVKEWKVPSWETLSDHRHIEIALSETRAQMVKRRQQQPRWRIKATNDDLLSAALIAGTLVPPTINGESNLEVEAEKLQATLTMACNVAIPRARPLLRKAMPWWSEELAGLRKRAMAARRDLKRTRKNVIDQDELQQKVKELRHARETFKVAMAKAKRKSWKDLTDTLNEDPWGRPYRVVLDKLRRWTPPYTESLERQILECVLDTLFPHPENSETWEEPQLPSDGPGAWTPDLQVSAEELAHARKRMLRKNAVPGLSGIPSRVWGVAVQIVGEGIRMLFTECLRRGTFPAIWRRAKLVLLRKPGKPVDSASGYRPICLLDDEAKLLERIIADRVVCHLDRRGPKLCERQFGFRRGRSTTDAILCVRQYIEDSWRNGEMVIGISLDIRNAFNSLPWDQIGKALRRHRVPPYLRRIIRSYLQERRLQYTIADGTTEERAVGRGVQQGSILGPLLWDLGYDVLRDAEVPSDSITVGYADDTIILVTGST